MIHIEDNIRVISVEDAEKIINTPRTHKHRFVVYEGPDQKIVGLDNSTGDAWTEDFESLGECLDWLTQLR